MVKRLKRILIATAIGLVLCTAGVWALTRLLDEGVPRYQGRLLSSWRDQANSADAAASAQARFVVNTNIIPQLERIMFTDTNDSRLRLAVIDQLNDLPGVHIYFTVAYGRRAAAAEALGELGPLAQAAIPDLLKALKGRDPALRPNAAVALGQIHSQPELIIPLLVTLLDDAEDGVPASAATALGEFGELSKPAVPKLLEMSKIREKDLHAAVMVALKHIAPDEASKVGY